MIAPIVTVVLGVHVLAGGIALLAGAAAILTTKGSRRHLTAGRWYVIAMVVVVLTAVPLSIIIESGFLLAIAIFTGYLLFAGIRVLPRRRSHVDGFGLVDVVGHGTMLIVGSGMLLAGTWETLVGPVELGPMLIVFGIVGIGLAGRELHTLGQPLPDQIPWFNRHIGFMGGAYIATVTAAIVVNLTMLPPLARWLSPTLIGVPCIVLATRKYESRYRPEGRRSATSRSSARATEVDGD